MNQDKIGRFIKSIRLENNLTQKELADILGVTYQAVSKWENGKNIPDIGILKEISSKFNVDIEELLNGEKNLKKNKYKKSILLLIIVIIIIIGLIIILLNIKSRDFEFKTISSSCQDFKITGSAAYNRDKTSIYISNIEFCGKNKSERYKEITCVLYEKNNDVKKEISTCTKKNNISLKDYLKEMDIKVNNYNTVCKRLTSNNLILEINALDNENKTIKYTIPIKLNDTCKKS